MEGLNKKGKVILALLGRQERDKAKCYSNWI